MSAKERILFLTHVGEMGGAEAKMISLANSIEKTKHICLFQHGSLEAKIKNEELEVSVLEMPKAVSSFKRENGILGALKLIPLMLGYIKRLAKFSKQYDVIVCMSQKSFVLSSFAKPLTRKPIIWFMNDLLSPDDFNKHLIKFLTLLSKFTADYVVLNSESSKEAWRNVGGKKKNVEIIYSGIDMHKFENLGKTDEAISSIKARYVDDKTPLIGMFGRITPWKGQHVFIEAIAKLDNAHGLIVGEAQFGEEEYKKELEQLIEKHGLQDRITFAGHIEDIPEFMAACDLITHCSTSAEPFGRVIVEAKLAKTPVIATKAGGAQEIIRHGETGYLYPAGDADKLAEFMKLCLSEHNQPDDVMVKAAYERAKENYTSAIMVERFQEILKDV